MSPLVRRILREPLFHFLVLGLGLFLVFSVVRDPISDSSDRIVVSTGQIEQLAELFTRTWQRPPTADELEGLIQEHIKEEVFYREALAMGLDRDDTVVRRRLRQKVEFLTDDLLATLDPTEEQLQSYLAKNADDFRIAPRVSFSQVYLNPDRHGDEVYRVAERLLVDLQSGGSDSDAAVLGDPVLLPGEYDQESEDRIAGEFGRGFAARLADLSVGRWTGPVESTFGVHLVLIRERIAGKAPTLDTVRDAVVREWMTARREETAKAFYQTLRQRYSVIVEEELETDDGEVATAAEMRR